MLLRTPNTSAEILNHDVTRISEWTYRWKMSFKPDPSKQAQKVLYFNKATKTDHPSVIFNGNILQNSANQKHLGLILDKKLTFNDHITSKLATVNKLTITFRKIYRFISRNSLIAIYKSFVRMHLAYADAIFDKLSNATFSNEIKPAQHNAALAIAGTIRDTSKEKLYQELGLEVIKERRFPRLCCLYKTLDNLQIIYSLFPPPNRHYNTQTFSKIKQIFCRTGTFSNSFLPRKLENGTNLIFCLSSSFIFSYFAEHFWTLSDQLQIALLKQMLFLV